jgi:hypothetical protein
MLYIYGGPIHPDKSTATPATHGDRISAGIGPIADGHRASHDTIPAATILLIPIQILVRGEVVLVSDIVTKGPHHASKDRTHDEPDDPDQCPDHDIFLVVVLAGVTVFVFVFWPYNLVTTIP